MFNWIKKLRTNKELALAPEPNEIKSGAYGGEYFSSFPSRQFFFLGGADEIGIGDNYEAYAAKGYASNTIVFKAITSIAKACSDIDINITINGVDIEDVEESNDKFVKFIMRPNSTQNYKTLIYNAITHKLISGNAYFKLIKGVNGAPAELSLMRPDRVIIRVSGNQIPYEYQYTIGGNISRYPIDPITLFCEQVYHYKAFSPLSDLYGMSPIAPAALSIEQHNLATKSNNSLLKNSSRPQGIISMKDKGDNAPPLTKQQRDDIREMVNESFGGVDNVGKIPIFSHDMQFQSISFSPVDMDWLNAKTNAAREICLALGYPSHLLGFPDSSKFDNMASAKMEFYEETVIPELSALLCGLAHWLSQTLNIDIKLEPDLDSVTALAPRQEAKRNNARLDYAAGIITLNEARRENDYPDVANGDENYVPAGKLPVSFDSTALTEGKFIDWLVEDGYTKDMATNMAKMAFNKDVKNVQGDK